MRQAQGLVAFCLVFASAMGIANFAIQPAFSQTFVTVTSYQTYVAVSFTTSTSFLTYVSTQISRSASLTYITTVFTTTTSYLTYVSVMFTTSTNVIGYPVPNLNFAIGLTILLQDLIAMLCVFVVIYATMRPQAFLEIVRRIILS